MTFRDILVILRKKSLKVYIMTLQEFSRDIVPIIGVIVTTTGLIFIWLQIRCATQATKQTSSWNSIISIYSFFNIEHNQKLRDRLYSEGKAIDVRFQYALTDEQIKKIRENDECFLNAKEYIKDFETLCAVYQLGALDPELVFSIFGPRVVNEFDVFKPLIDVLRKEKNDMGVMIEFERTALEWKEKINIEKEERLKKLMSDTGIRRKEF